MKTRIICIAVAVLVGTFGLVGGLVAGAGPAAAAGTPTLTINSVAVNEGNGNGSSVITFTVTLANPSSLNVSALWKTVPVTASEAPSGSHCDGTKDYIQQLPTALPTLNSAFPTQQISVTTCADGAAEANETFDIVLSSPTTGAALGTPSTGVGTFIDDDPVPSVTVPNFGVAEPAATVTATVPVNVSNPSGSAITFNWATASTGSATAGAACGGTVDFVTATGQVHVPAYSTTPDVPLRVTMCHDATNGASETFKLNITNYSTNVSGQTTSATVTIGSGQTGGVGVFVNDPAPVSESHGTVSFDIDIRGTNHIHNFDVNYQLLDNGGGATGGTSCTTGVDYVRQSGFVVFPNNVNVIHVPVTICNDTLDENDESFDLVVSGATGFNVIDNVGRATIQDDDAPPSLAIAAAHAQPEGSAGGTTSLPIIWILSSNGHAQASAKPITFHFDTADMVGGAKSGTCGVAGVDYQAVHQTVTINPGARVGSVSVPVCAERVVEAAESFAYSASGFVNALVGGHTGTGTILNDDGTVPSIAAVTTTEGNSGQHTASLVVRFPTKPTRAGTLLFDVGGSAVAGTGTTCATSAAGSDYLRVTKNPVAFTAGATSVTLDFTICGDTQFEVDETVSVSVTSVDWFGVGARGTLTIHNDDPLPG